MTDPREVATRPLFARAAIYVLGTASGYLTAKHAMGAVGVLGALLAIGSVMFAAKWVAASVDRALLIAATRGYER
jgi:hypothetical protein